LLLFAKTDKGQTYLAMFWNLANSNPFDLFPDLIQRKTFLIQNATLAWNAPAIVFGKHWQGSSKKLDHDDATTDPTGQETYTLTIHPSASVKSDSTQGTVNTTNPPTKCPPLFHRSF